MATRAELQARLANKSARLQKQNSRLQNAQANGNAERAARIQGRMANTSAKATATAQKLASKGPSKYGPAPQASLVAKQRAMQNSQAQAALENQKAVATPKSAITSQQATLRTLAGPPEGGMQPKGRVPAGGMGSKLGAAYGNLQASRMYKKGGKVKKGC